MQWVLIAMLCSDAFCFDVAPKEIATFPDQASCQEAAKQYEGHKPVCGIKRQ